MSPAAVSSMRSSVSLFTGSGTGPKDAQNPSAIQTAAAPDLCKLLLLRAGHTRLSCELDAASLNPIRIYVNAA